MPYARYPEQGVAEVAPEAAEPYLVRQPEAARRCSRSRASGPSPNTSSVRRLTGLLAAAQRPQQVTVILPVSRRPT